MSAALAVNESNFDAEVIRASAPVLVDFWSEGCGPCRMLSPVLDEIAAEQAGRAKVVKIKAEENPMLASKLGVRAVPTLLFFKDGQVREQVTGLKSKRDLIAKLDALA